MAYYEGDVIVSACVGCIVRMQIDDTDDRHWEAFVGVDAATMPGTSGVEPVRVQLSDPEDVRDGWSAPARWTWTTEEMVLVGEDRFRGPGGS